MPTNKGLILLNLLTIPPDKYLNRLWKLRGDLRLIVKTTHKTHEPKLITYTKSPNFGTTTKKKKKPKMETFTYISSNFKELLHTGDLAMHCSQYKWSLVIHKSNIYIVRNETQSIKHFSNRARSQNKKNHNFRS